MFVLHFLHVLLCHIEGATLKTVTIQIGQKASSFSMLCLLQFCALQILSVEYYAFRRIHGVFVEWMNFSLTFPWSYSRLGGIWQC